MFVYLSHVCLLIGCLSTCRKLVYLSGACLLVGGLSTCRGLVYLSGGLSTCRVRVYLSDARHALVYLSAATMAWKSRPSPHPQRILFDSILFYSISFHSISFHTMPFHPHWPVFVTLGSGFDQWRGEIDRVGLIGVALSRFFPVSLSWLRRWHQSSAMSQHPA